MSGENIRFIEPNLAMYFTGTELKFWNLVWGLDQTAAGWDQGTGFITNMLVQKTSDGSVVPPAYPTLVELQTQVESLEYDGLYFWSIQPINDTPFYPGFVIRKWEINEDQYGLGQVAFKTFPGFYKPSAMALEHYTFPLRDSVDPSLDSCNVAIEYDWIIDRLRVGQTIRIGPNTPGDVFWGTIKRVYAWPDDPYFPTEYYKIQFTENFNTSYVAGQDIFAQTRLFVFDEGGTFYQIDPTTFEVVNQVTSDIYKQVSAAGFSIIQYVDAINVGQRTPVLFYVRGMVVYCLRIADMSSVLAAQSMHLNMDANGNDPLAVYELRIRNDDYTDVNNHPQHYLLQSQYRADYDSAVESWSTYNYVIQNVDRASTFMVLNMDPVFIPGNEIADCRCTVLDNYRFPVYNAEVNWTVTSGAGVFLDGATTYTNASGIAYNRLQTYSGVEMPFPAYVTTTSPDL